MKHHFFFLISCYKGGDFATEDGEGKTDHADYVGNDVDCYDSHLGDRLR